MSRTKTSWTTPADLKVRLLKLWDQGTLLASMVQGESLFPLRFKLKEPDSRQLSERFADVQNWIAQLTAASGLYRIVRRTVKHRVLGSNDIPTEIWFDSMDHALRFIGRQHAASTFTSLVTLTREQKPCLLPWISKRPIRALELAEVWPLMLQTVVWLQKHPRPGIYLRQIDSPGVHSKFIESHRSVLSELFDLALPPEAIDTEATGNSNFCRRYGFRDKPLRVRFRLLDPDLAILSAGTDQDITITREAFACIDLPAETVFITENEINFLTFPQVRASMVIFGAGYGFRNLADIDWLQNRKIYYWGDIDTHGFAILNQFREFFPCAESFLMDRETLLNHSSLWETENHPETARLTRLTSAEKTLYEDLCHNRYGNHVRLEQEKIGFNTLLETLEKIEPPPFSDT